MWRVQSAWSRSPVRGGYDPGWVQTVTKKEEKFTKSQRFGQSVDCGNSRRHHTKRHMSQSKIDSCKSTEQIPIFQHEFLRPFYQDVNIYDATVKFVSRNLSSCWSCINQIPNGNHQSALSDGPPKHISSRWNPWFFRSLCICGNKMPTRCNR